MITLTLKDYPVFCRLGCLPSEAEKEQEILVTVRWEQASPNIDDLGEVMDYRILWEAITKTLEGKRIFLLEKAVSLLFQELEWIFEGFFEVILTKKTFPDIQDESFCISASLQGQGKRVRS